MTDVVSKETGSKDYKDTFDVYPNAPETKYLNKHNMIQEESGNEMDEEINIDNLQTELDKFTNNINQLKNQKT